VRLDAWVTLVTGAPYFVMPPKRRRGDDNEVIKSSEDLRDLLTSAITTHGSAEIALLHLMSNYDFSLDHLQKVLLGISILSSFSEAVSVSMSSLDVGLSVSFSQVTYAKIAKFVGLDPYRRLKDIQTFELHRSRIPTALFKSIVQDMDMMMVQYGPIPDHDHEEATSRFLSPVRIIQHLDCDKPKHTASHRSSTVLWQSLALLLGTYRSLSSAVASPRRDG
jgi:hypothetical protein